MQQYDSILCSRRVNMFIICSLWRDISRIGETQALLANWHEYKAADNLKDRKQKHDLQTCSHRHPSKYMVHTAEPVRWPSCGPCKIHIFYTSRKCDRGQFVRVSFSLFLLNVKSVVRFSVFVFFFSFSDGKPTEKHKCTLGCVLINRDHKSKLMLYYIWMTDASTFIEIGHKQFVW